MRDRYACGWVPRFAAAALVRSDPALHGRPVAAMTATPATRTVCEVTVAAWAQGVRPGMSASEALARAPALVCRDRDLEAERSAAAALRDAAWATSPRVEVIAPGRVHLDLAGLAVLLGDEARIGQRLVEAITALNLPAHVGIADTRTAAALAARLGPGLTRVPPGAAPAWLGPAPLALLDPAPELALTLVRWGLRTLGELAALPRAALLARLGPAGVHLQALARGEDPLPFVAAPPEERWIEALALDWEVTSLAALVFVLQRLLARLEARLVVRDLGATALHLTAGLADGSAHTHRLALVAPLREPRTLLGLLQAELERQRLPAPIVALTVEAETAPLAALQTDLFAPPRPSPRELGETLGRLAALVGPERVGAPVLADTHRPDAIGMRAFTHVEEYRPPGGGGPRGGAVGTPPPVEKAALVCRRLVPPRPAVVTTSLADDARLDAPAGPPASVGDPPLRPRHVEAPGVRGPVVAWAGPWRTAGEWWTETAWTREEWDVALPDGAVYRLALDRATGAWTIDAVYD